MRYIDDLFLLWPNSENFDQFLLNINLLNESIKFKYEWENDNKLPFLDVLVHRNSIENKFNFSVFRKPTSTNAYIHYFSQHSDSIKKSVLFSMFLRAYRICDPDLISNEVENIKNIFKQLCYPVLFIDEAHLKARRKYFNQQNIREREEDNRQNQNENSGSDVQNNIITIDGNNSLDSNVINHDEGTGSSVGHSSNINRRKTS